MSRVIANPDPENTLPRPELNPIINPVLAANMGRWAEVYFTSPPDKREEAVQELLRELQGEAPAVGTASAEKGEIPQQIQVASAKSSGSFKEAAQPVATEGENAGPSAACRSCGRSNPAEYQFCGACGADLQQAPATPAIDLNQESLNQESDVSFALPSTNRNRSIEERTVLDDGPQLLLEPEPRHHRYGVFIGVGLAILVGGLTYTVWRGTQPSTERSQSSPVAAAPAMQPTVQSPAPASATPETTANETPNVASHEAEAPVMTADKSATQPATQPETSSNATTAPAVTAVAPKPVSIPPPVGDGSEELAIARNYLNGTHGARQDSAEAAKWLWKSMAKKNPKAALLLSDLYLQGNGVVKSCDQARLLLESASRQGVAAAAEKINRLPSLGCP